MVAPNLRIGVIGLGSVAEVHLAAYREVCGAQVVAGSDPRADRLASMASRFGLQPFLDFREMLQEMELDAACVLVPCAAHHDVTVACADAGLHVLCEKPIALTLPQAEDMAAACERNGVKFFYGASYRFLPAVIKARELVQSGAIGDVTMMIEMSVGGGGTTGYQALPIAHYPPGSPGGPGLGLVDHGIHLIDVFGWIIDAKVERVIGQGIISGQPPVPEYMVMHFDKGAVGHLLYNDYTFSTDLPQHGAFSWGTAWDNWGRLLPQGSWLEHPQAIHIFGTRGALRVGYYINALHLMDGSGMRQVPVLDRPAPSQFAMQLEAFARCIESDTTPAVTAQDGIDALRALLAVYESMAEGRVITL